MKKGQLITVEGIEGAGKSTVLHTIKCFLMTQPVDFILTREPGGTPWAEEIRELLLHSEPEETLTAEAELLLMFAARAQHLKTSILPNLFSNKWVISDRFIDASYAYQGGGRGISLEKIAMLDRWIVGEHYPSLTLLLDIDVNQGFNRTRARGTRDRIEKETVEFFERVRKTYLERALADPSRIKLVDASQPLSDVEREIHAILNNFLQSRL